jgi:hypothetical protein
MIENNNKIGYDMIKKPIKKLSKKTSKKLSNK